MPNSWISYADAKEMDQDRRIKQVARVYSGADAVKAADALRQQAERREAWPYLHIHPPPNAEDVHEIGTVETPAQGSTAVVLTYTVPSGYRFYLRAIVQNYVGGAFSPGDALWTVDRNRPVGIPDVQGQPEQGLVNVPVDVGLLKPFEPDVFRRAREFEELDVVRSKATNVNLGVAAPNFFVSAFLGYIVPMTANQR